MRELAPSALMAALALLRPAQQKELAQPRVGLLVAALVLLLLLVPVPAPSEVVVIASSTSEPIAISSAAPPRRHVPRLRRGVRVRTPRFLLSGARRAHSAALVAPLPLAELAVALRWRRGCRWHPRRNWTPPWKQQRRPPSCSNGFRKFPPAEHPGWETEVSGPLCQMFRSSVCAYPLSSVS